MFPSCYTEKRLNLLKLYSEIERKSGNELLDAIAVDEEWTWKRGLQEYKAVIAVLALFILFVVII